MRLHRLKITFLKCIFGINPIDHSKIVTDVYNNTVDAKVDIDNNTVDAKVDIDNKLYVVLAYFNYCNSGRRRELFLDFVKRYASTPGLEIVVVEGALVSEQFQLPSHIDGVKYHFGFKLQNQLWVKENLINLAIRRLPKSWQYTAWIDADITFLNTNWVQETVCALETTYDVLQPFHTAIHMGPCEESLKIERSFGYMHTKSGHKWVKSHKYGFWHPGFGWAINRKFYDKIDGLIDFAILGSGDHHMSLAFVQNVDCSYPGGIHPNYIEKLREFQRRCLGCRLGYIKGTITHHWHGRLEDRKYVERWNVLVKGKYDPLSYIRYNGYGVVEFTDAASDIIEPIREYFSGRREDNMEL